MAKIRKIYIGNIYKLTEADRINNSRAKIVDNRTRAYKNIFNVVRYLDTNGIPNTSYEQACDEIDFKKDYYENTDELYAYFFRPHTEEEISNKEFRATKKRKK